MLEGPTRIGSSPVLPRNQTLACFFNILILCVVWNLSGLFFVSFFFFPPLTTPEVTLTDVLQLAPDISQPRFLAAPPQRSAARWCWDRMFMCLRGAAVAFWDRCCPQVRPKGRAHAPSSLQSIRSKGSWQGEQLSQV